MGLIVWDWDWVDSRDGEREEAGSRNRGGEG